MTTNKRALDRAPALAQALHLLAGASATTARLPFFEGAVAGAVPQEPTLPDAVTGWHTTYLLDDYAASAEAHHSSRTTAGAPTTSAHQSLADAGSARGLVVAGGRMYSISVCGLRDGQHRHWTTAWAEARIVCAEQQSDYGDVPCAEVRTCPVFCHSAPGTPVPTILGGCMDDIDQAALEPGMFIFDGTPLLPNKPISDGPPPSVKLGYSLNCALKEAGSAPRLVGANFFDVKFTHPAPVFDLASHAPAAVGTPRVAADLLVQCKGVSTGLEDNPTGSKPDAEVINLFPSRGNASANGASGMPGEERNSGQRVAGVRERVVARLSAAVGELSRDDTPIEWAMLQQSLGAAHLEARGGDRPEAVELAILCFEAALAVAAAQPNLRGMTAATYGKLATAYRDRVAGDRAENLERALRYLEESFETGVTTADERPGIFDKQSAWDAL